MKKQGFWPSLGVVGYVVALSTFFSNANKFFPKVNTILIPMMMLSIFCLSVLVCGLLVFYRPYMLFMEKRGKEAASMVVATTKWLGVWVVIVVGAVFILAR
jgi:hypothetical protein